MSHAADHSPWQYSYVPLMSIDSIATNSAVLLIGAITGGFLGALVTGLVWWFDRRSQTARDLLSEGLTVFSLKEAWVLEGPSYNCLRLSEIRVTETEYSANGLWLRAVEIRAIFDEARWNAPPEQFYAFLGPRRAWIVRDTILGTSVSYDTWTGGVPPHPSLLSSRGMDEICGWIERVTAAHMDRRLSNYGCRLLRTSLVPVVNQDRTEIFGERLTQEARTFLKWYREKYVQKN